MYGEALVISRCSLKEQSAHKCRMRVDSRENGGKCLGSLKNQFSGSFICVYDESIVKSAA